MEHHIARDLLAAYVDDDLEARTRAELEQHLESCDECRTLIDGSEVPVDLKPAGVEGEPVWDERRMRKTVRRTLLRVVSGVVSIWIIGFIVLAIVSALAVQPLVVARGDRARNAGIATWDLPVLVTPGASVDRWTADATLFGRDLSVKLVRFVGSEPRPLGVFETDLGLFSFSQRGANPVNPYVGGSSRKFVPQRLPAGTVVTVQLLWFDQPLSVEDAEALIPDPEQATVLWAGFDVSPALGGHLDGFPGDPGAVLGYHTCEAPRILDLGGSFFSAGSAMSSGTVTGCFFQPASVAHALSQTRRATLNLASNADLIEALEDSSLESLQNVADVAVWLGDNQPGVASLVVTGPTNNVARILEASGADEAVQLDVDFWNWPTS